ANATSAPTAIVVETPAPTAAPAISGSPAVGKRLAASKGSWRGPPTRFRYQWLRCSSTGTACVAIPGATHAKYTATKRDAHHRLRVRVTAVNAAGRKTSRSRATHVVTP